MDAIEMIKERRSVRKFKNEKVDRELMKEIVDIAKWAPSWVNYQIARYTLVDDEEIIKEIAHEGVNGFVYNIDTLKNADIIYKSQEDKQDIFQMAQVFEMDVVDIGRKSVLLQCVHTEKRVDRLIQVFAKQYPNNIIVVRSGAVAIGSINITER